MKEAQGFQGEDILASPVRLSTQALTCSTSTAPIISFGTLSPFFWKKTPEVTINLQDYFVHSALGVPGGSNQIPLRGLVPVGMFGGIGQLARFTVPIATTPALPTGRETAVGDVTLTDFCVLPGKITFAGGPVLVLPSWND